MVKQLDGRVRRCHQDQLCFRSVEVPSDRKSPEFLIPIVTVATPAPVSGSSEQPPPVGEKSAVSNYATPSAEMESPQ